VRNQALNQVSLKIQDVNDLASTQLQKIEGWKAGKLYDIGQWAYNRLNELGSAKAQASTQEQQTINQEIANTQTDLTNRLRQLDDAVTNYRQSIESWQMQRQADLEDWAKKLQMSAQYTPATAGGYEAAKLSFSTTTNPLTGESWRIGQNPYTGEIVWSQQVYPAAGAEEEEEPTGLKALLKP